MSRGLFVTVYFIIPGSAVYLGMLHTTEDQDTLEKVDQGSKTHFMCFQVSLMHTEQHHFFFFTSSTPLSLTQNVDLFVNYYILDGFVSL